ncbi:MAG: hypothetical protein COB66_06330 [Coxiella sp. (in: Bacteria)]|nr:MAG: hypothetical protein COB66_06330 [Coxiella sp. (in: g-proteobacteria)]
MPPVTLLGEYVIEMLFVIYENLNNLDLEPYKNFIFNNQEFYCLIKQRVASYWNCYYRWNYKDKKDYVGFKILTFIDSYIKDTDDG